MKLANMVGERFKERPSDCVIDSHAFSVRVTIGPKNLANGQIELSTRDKSVKKLVAVEDAVTETKNLVRELFEAINSAVRPRK